MKKILLIEDNADIRNNAAEILSFANYDVLTAENGKEGITAALKYKPDIIICDIMMPVLDGYGVIHALQKNPEMQHIPFIFLTAKTEREEIRQGMKMGADDYITKPFNDIDLLDAIESRLKKVDILKSKFSEGISGLKDLVSTFNSSKKLETFVSEYIVNTYRKKMQIYAQGTRPTYIFYVKKGIVKTVMVNEDGRELVTSLYSAGEFFGYTALFEGTNYKETAEVMEEADIAIIPKNELEELLNTSPDVLRKFIQILACNVAEREQHLLEIAYNSLRKRIASALVEIHDRQKKVKAEPDIIEITRNALASMAGTVTESTIRTLSDFKEEKLIDITDRQIKIINRSKLEKMVN